MNKIYAYIPRYAIYWLSDSDKKDPVEAVRRAIKQYRANRTDSNPSRDHRDWLQFYRGPIHWVIMY